MAKGDCEVAEAGDGKGWQRNVVSGVHQEQNGRRGAKMWGWNQAGMAAWGLQWVGPGSGGPRMLTLKGVEGLVGISCRD